MSDCAPTFQLSLLGGFNLRFAEEPVTIHETGARLLVLLALARNGRQPLSRATVGQRMWDSDPARASARLRSVLWRLPKRGEQRLVDGTATTLRLSDHVDVDMWQAESHARHLASNAQPAPREALDLAPFVTDLLPDWPEDWLLLERESFRQTRLHALERVSDLLRTAGLYEAALHAALLAVNCEPLRETAHRRVIQAHLAEDNQAEALRQYQTYRRLLGVELGLVPSPTMRSLLAPLLARPADHRSPTRASDGA